MVGDTYEYDVKCPVMINEYDVKCLVILYNVKCPVIKKHRNNIAPCLQ